MRGTIFLQDQTVADVTSSSRDADENNCFSSKISRNTDVSVFIDSSYEKYIGL